MGQERPIGMSYDQWWEHFGRDAGIPYDPPIQAIGGRIVKVKGGISFFLDEETRDRIEAGTGERPPDWIKTEVTFCNPTPGTMAALGDFVDPETRLNCFIDLPEEWRMAWMDAQLSSNLRFYQPEGVPPYWGQWGVHEGGGIIGDCGKVGPFDTIEEAFSAAAEEAHKHGAELLPMNGFAQVVDSRGQGVGPIT